MLPDIIETERLRLRLFGFQDLDDVLSYATDPEWARYLPVPQPYTRADAQRFLAGPVLLDRAVHTAWAIVHGDSVMGGINIRFDFANGIGEMGSSLARSNWGKGLITEAAHAVMDRAFETYPDLNRVRAMADSRNVASLRVMEKLGRVREGILRQNRGPEVSSLTRSGATCCESNGKLREADSRDNFSPVGNRKLRYAWG